MQLREDFYVENVLQAAVKSLHKYNNRRPHEKHKFNLTTAKTMTMMRVYLF